LYIQRESKRSRGEVFFVQQKRIEEEYRKGLLCTAKENRRGTQKRSSLYSQRESKRSTGEVFFVQPRRIEEEYRRGLLCTAKENRRGVQERSSLYNKDNRRGVQERSSLCIQRESKRSKGEVFFVQPKRTEETYRKVFTVLPVLRE
jgi:hypothetical protein